MNLETYFKELEKDPESRITFKIKGRQAYLPNIHWIGMSVSPDFVCNICKAEPAFEIIKRDERGSYYLSNEGQECHEKILDLNPPNLRIPFGAIPNRQTLEMVMEGSGTISGLPLQYEYKGYTFRGVLDLVNIRDGEVYSIEEWKFPTNGRLDIENRNWSYQLRTYCYFFWLLFGKAPKFRILRTWTRKAFQEGQVIPSLSIEREVDSNSLGDFPRGYLSKILNFYSGKINIVPTYNDMYCKYCDVKVTCRNWR